MLDQMFFDTDMQKDIILYTYMSDFILYSLTTIAFLSETRIICVFNSSLQIV